MESYTCWTSARNLTGYGTYILHFRDLQTVVLKSRNFYVLFHSYSTVVFSQRHGQTSWLLTDCVSFAFLHRLRYLQPYHKQLNLLVIQTDIARANELWNWCWYSSTMVIYFRFWSILSMHFLELRGYVILGSPFLTCRS